VFLNNDERWSNFRDYCFDGHGAIKITFVFGVIISFVCPFIFYLQNVLLGFIVSGQFNKDTLRHVFITTQTQLVVIYDTSVFYKTNKDIRNGILAFGKIAAGYFVYMLPVGFIGYLFLFVYSTSFICHDLKSPFLLNNTIKPVVNMSELYRMKRECTDDTKCVNARTE